MWWKYFPFNSFCLLDPCKFRPLCFQVRTEKSNKLELHFRPEDPYSHPAFGELQPCNNFLLKISKKKVKDIRDFKELDSIPKQASADSLHLNKNNLIPGSTETSEHSAQPGCDVSAPSNNKAQIRNEAHEHLSADIVARVSEEYHFNGDPYFHSSSFPQLMWKLCSLFMHLMPSSFYFLKAWWITSMYLLFMLM